MASRALYKAVAPARGIAARQSNLNNSISLLDLKSNMYFYFSP